MKRVGIEVVAKGGTAQIAQMTVQPTLQKQVIDAQKSNEHLSKGWNQTETERQWGIQSLQTRASCGKTTCVPEMRKCLKTS